ncbi:hypothetical protein ACFL0X_00805 [Nanoarchaeota archaeon]
MKKVVLLLSKYFDNKILTRHTISTFFEKINKIKAKNIVIDFKGIDFISRSCADEYLKLKKKTEKELIEKNLNDAVSSMFKLVKTQQQVCFTYLSEDSNNYKKKICA